MLESTLVGSSNGVLIQLRVSRLSALASLASSLEDAVQLQAVKYYILSYATTNGSLVLVQQT